MARTLRAGVIGAGVFGGYHAQKWAGFEDAELTAIFDSHPERAEALAARFGSRAFDDLPAFFDAVDLVSITTPAISHGPRALQALKAGKPVYIEKPLAVTPNDADAIVAEAARRGLVVACGFSERVAMEAIGLFAVSDRPSLIEATRLGAPSPRNQDVSVVLDLMIHDLDIALRLAAGSALTVEAEGVAGATGLLDEVRAEITFDSGVVARLHASRVAPAADRRMRIAYQTGTVDIDFVSGALGNATSFPLDPQFAATPASRDRLNASLARFVSAVRGDGVVVADARDGVRALDLALAVEQAAEG
jgi:predicted dehydrogenase